MYHLAVDKLVAHKVVSHALIRHSLLAFLLLKAIAVMMLFGGKALASDMAIVKQPVNVAVTAGQRAVFEVKADNALWYQWRHNRERLPGDLGKRNVLVLDNVTKDDAGSYYCIVMRQGEAIMTKTVKLTVTEEAKGNAVIRWQAPRYRVDGSEIEADTIANYKIYRHIRGQRILEGATAGSGTVFPVFGLSYGEHQFSLATVDTDGLESAPSSPFSVVID